MIFCPFCIKTKGKGKKTIDLSLLDAELLNPTRISHSNRFPSKTNQISVYKRLQTFNKRK